MSSDQVKIVFTPSGRRGQFASGTTVLEAARSLGVDLDSVCGGRGICGRCQIDCMEGEFPKHGLSSATQHLSAVGEAEHRYSTRKTPLGDTQRLGQSPGRRLGCQARLLDDVVVDVPPESQIHRQLVRKQADARDIALDVSTHLYFVEVEPAALEQSRGDLARLLDALAREWQLQDLSLDSALLPQLQPLLRQGNWQVTVAVYQDQQIIAIWPGFKQDIYGVALDIGSTTLAAHLCHLSSGEVVATAGMMNPQIRFGEDLMSRVSWVMMHPEGDVELTQAVREGINQLLDSVAREAGIECADILELSVAGNPIMHHLFLGINPIELGSAPFALAVDSALNLQARDLGLRMNRGARVYVLPCIAGHVGADAAAMVLAEQPHTAEALTLVVDVGTNAEIVLGNRNGLLACSSPTGPAFEGAQISCGQRAAPGAIERVRIDAATLAVRFRVIGSDCWSDEPGFDEAVQACGVTGICGSGIIEAVAEMYLAGIISEDGVIDGSLAHRTANLIAADRTWSFVLHAGNPPETAPRQRHQQIPEQLRVVVTQTDVRQIQLAKAALYAGIQLLMDRAGTDRVDSIRLAGAFGSHIDPRYAMVLGLIPDCALAEVRSAGNAAGTGARIALLNRTAREEIETVVRGIGKIETAIEPAFQEHFVAAMAIPHKHHPFTKLFAEVSRPAAKLSNDESNPGQQRQRRRRSRNAASGATP